MKRRLFLAGSAIAVLGASVGFAGEAKKGKGPKATDDKDHKDDVVGTRWEYKIESNGETEKGTFRCENYDLYRGDTKIGRVMPKSKTETRLVITQYPPLNGNIILKKVGTHPARWTGTVFRADGVKAEIHIEVKDK